jgi:hypothetical protein|tara:strand:+ start:1309 stop:1515 length:207 start_codon:yes stop_codon:yes gene_type:complete
VQRRQRQGRLSRRELLCQAAASGGKLEELKILRENGCPWDEQTSYAAWSRRHFEILTWTLVNGSRKLP